MNAVSEAPSLSTAAPALEELMSQLLQLSANARLEIIARLARSLKSEPSALSPADQQITLPAFAGAWANDPEAEKMEQAILAIRPTANEVEVR